MNKINAKITKHVNDIIQKYASGLFRNASLEFYGIKTAPIRELINPELPVVEVTGGAADVIFLLEDDSYLHFAFETGYNKDALTKCAGYDLRLFERDGRLIHTVVIYTADVKEKPIGLNTGSLEYNPDMILMGEYDGNVIFAELETKIKDGGNLTDTDMLNLVLLPLMKHTISRKELAAKSIQLAQDIPDTTKRNACVAAAFAFASRYLNEADRESLLEVLKMSELAVMLVMDAVKDKSVEIARKMLRRNTPIEIVAEDTGLDESTIRQLKAELNNDN